MGSSTTVDALFDEFAARFARGERPDVREFLGRAGEGADELGALIDRFLSSSEPPAPDDATIAAVRAWMAGEPPLVALRAGRGLKVDAVVAMLAEAFGVGESKRSKLKRYYQQLEGGTLDPRGVDERVLARLSEWLGARVADLAALRPRPLAGEAMYMRAGEPVTLERRTFAVEEAPDEVDRLFRSYPE